MTSFVNLLANDIWSDADITRRTEAMIRSHFSETQELILQRKIAGAQSGQYILTNEDKNDIARFQQVVLEAQQAGIDARQDMILLNEILIVEKSYQRLRLPLVEPIYENNDAIATNQIDIDRDILERAEAQSVVDLASSEIMDWVIKRNPEPEISLSESQVLESNQEV